MSNPYFSIIIPTFNRASLLRKAIESVLFQTYPEWELIIIDDGSTDNTKEIIQKYSDNRIIYIYQQNKERSSARNNGIKHAKGKYICFLDSDDHFLPERLELIHKYIMEKNEAVALFYTAICFEKNGIVNEREQLEFSSDSNIYDYIIQAIIGVPQVCMHKKILEIKSFNEKFCIGEDMELWLQVAHEYPLIYIKDQPTVVALDHEERSVNVKKFNNAKEQLVMLKYIFSEKKYKGKISGRVKSLAISNCYFNIAKHHIYNRNKYKAIFNLMISMIKCALHPQTKHKVFLIFSLIINRKIEEYS